MLGGGSARLQVNAYDENGSPASAAGSIRMTLLPSAPGTGWLVSSTATTLWRSTEPGANAVRNLDPFTPMQQIDGPVQNRIEVQIYATDFSAALERGWIDTTDTGPALPPRMAVPAAVTPTLAPGRVLSTSQRQAFLDATASAARAGAAQTGVPASVTVAQAILESDWGRSLLALDANNYFGIKAIGRLGTDGVVWMSTGRVRRCRSGVRDRQRVPGLQDLTDSVADHDDLLKTASRYAAAMRLSNDPKQFAQQLSEAGYSTDPDYADKLVALMDRYDLYRLDA